MSSHVEIVCWGTPVPQGSFVALRSRQTNRPILKASNEAALRRWRNALTLAAVEAMQGDEPLRGPLRVLVLLTIGERPDSRRADLYPATPRRDDVDKHARAILDAIGGRSGGGPVIADDGLVVDLQVRKRWVGLAGGLPAPGVRVLVQSLDGLD